MSVLEKELEKKCKEYAELDGWLSIKVSPDSQRGWPDRVFISPGGKHIYVEFKMKGGQPRELQLYRMEQLRQHKCLVWLVDDVEDFKSWLGEERQRP